MAAQYGQMVFVGVDGISRNVDIYFDDTATNPVRFDGGAGSSATSPTFWTCPIAGYLIDVVLAAATAQTKTQINRNNMATGAILRNSVYLASVVTRPPLRLPYNRGSQISMTQLA